MKSVEFRKCLSSFQSNVENDIRKMNKFKDLIISSDKTNNLYFITKSEYNHLLLKNLTKNYKKAPANYLDKMNSNALNN